MKKIISFENELEFKSIIGEITSISLDEDLHFTTQSDVEGNLYLTGTYKMTEASQISDDFSFKIPVNITMLEQLDLSSSKIEIEDFKYEIVDENYLKYHIDIKIEGVEEINIKEEELENQRECDGDIKILDDNKESEIKDIDIIETKEDKVEEVEEEKQVKTEEVEKQVKTEEVEIEAKEKTEINSSSLFSSLKDEDDTFKAYSVYIVRQNETLDYIMNKYKVKKEDLENYNDLSNISIGTKLIIPSSNE